MEDDSPFRSSCFCPAGPSYKSAAEMTRAGTDEFTRVSYPTSQQFDTDGASFSAIACRSSVSGGRVAPLDQQMLQTVEDDEPSAETTVVREEVSDSALFLRGRTISDSAAEQEEEVVVGCCSLP